MAVYRFRALEPEGTGEEPIILDLPSLDLAREEAVRACGEVLLDRSGRRRPGGRTGIEVLDADGRSLLTVEVTIREGA